MENDEKKTGVESGNKLVTVAIHSYEKAIILKTILEDEGIPAVIQGINLIQPTIKGNVRVRINESDLQKALTVIEQVDFTSQIDKLEDLDSKQEKEEILIPIDFSSYTLKTCEFGFNLARDTNSKVKLFHVFFPPFDYMAMPFGESFAVSSGDKDMYQELRKKTEKEMSEFVALLKEKISNNEIEDIPFTYDVVEGLPEEEIIAYAKKVRPRAIVMGTRGGNAKSLDLIGSVTAEVIDGCRTPIFAIPEDSKYQDISQIKKIIFLTNFREREFKAFDTAVKFIKHTAVKVYLTHFGDKDDVWNKIKLTGVEKYLKERYSQLELRYKLLDKDERIESELDSLVKDKEIDLIVMSSSRRGIFARIFNPGIARKMIFHSDIPMLVIKGL